MKAFKRLIADMLRELPPCMCGAIVDDCCGRDALRSLTGAGRWLARPVEPPGSRPLAFGFPHAAAIEMRSWPDEHIAKCLALWCR